MPETLTLSQIKMVLKANNRMNRLARDLGVSSGAVSLVLSGRSRSMKIMEAARLLAQELLTEQRATQ